MFQFITNNFNNFIQKITSSFSSLFAIQQINQETLQELEKILIEADIGIKTTRYLLDNVIKKSPQTGAQLKQLLHQELISIIDKPAQSLAHVILLVGINGSGKTTAVSKLAYRLKQTHKKVLLVAADTFRAAAADQLTLWAQRLSCDIVVGKQHEDPAAVVYQGCEKFRTGGYDCIIIDTAGRLQTKKNLMQELAKIKRIIAKQLGEQHITTLLTIDAMLGQNSLEQAQIFHEATDIQGIILTKMDGTSKGGIVIAISHQLSIPVMYIAFGEKPDQLELFNLQLFIDQLLDS